MNITDRFSSHLKDVLTRSIHLASELKNPMVEPIHLFFAIFTQKGSVAGEILSRFKIEQKIIEQVILNLPATKEPPASPATKQSTQIVLTPFSPASKMALEKAMFIAHENHHNYIGTEHLLCALVEISDSILEEIWKINTIKKADLEKQLQTVLANATQFPQITEVAEAVDRIQDSLNDVLQPPEMESLQNKKGAKRKETALDFFATNLTNTETQKNIDPVIGRDQEIERVIQILSRRTKNNPVLLGDPGVGKTAIAEGLAKKILAGDVPDLLLNKKIYALDMGLLIAGTIYRGEFEGRLRQVMEEVAQDTNIILFIDEIHNIVGAGSNQGTMDAGNILKPVLARGQIRCIGATTPAEFKKYIESDAALERRFQPVHVKEPSPEDTVKILKGVKKNYELYHNVEITDEAVEAAVRLSNRYISNKFLPDKAIDLLDETSAAKRLKAKISSLDSKLARLKQKLDKATLEKEKAASEDKFEEAVKWKKEEEDILVEIKKNEETAKSKKIKTAGTVTMRDVAEQVSKITGNPPSELFLEEKDRLISLEKEIQKHIVGQNETVTEISRAIRQAQLNLSNPNRPLSSFLFIGDSGVGKTEMAKVLAKKLYPNADALIQLNMSEFNESFGVSKLLGSPAGYVGYKESNQFTDRVKMNPYCILLFDEIDKAHRDVTKLLLQILENGEITDSTGKKISLKHAIIILTTTYGAEEAKKGVFGFGHADDNKGESKKMIEEKLKEFFSPEIINRLDKICVFNPLSCEHLIKIAELEVLELNGRLAQYNTNLKTDEKILKWIIAQMNGQKTGARDIRREVRAQVENLMAEIILKEKVKEKYKLEVKDDRLTAS
ncbi:MAG: ATP-dependent Clp protease ATP-binding subunit [bacterium]|nr:ATP-dependent Clp protease ATP-binding subunit [Patescibacteria group bacterium]